MHGDARLGESPCRLGQLELRRFHIHPGKLRTIDHGFGTSDLGLQAFEALVDSVSGLAGGVCFRMAVTANGMRASPDKSVIGMLDPVAGVASDATRSSQKSESFLVRAFLEELGLLDVASDADISRRLKASRRRAVAAVAGGASRCAEIAGGHHGLVVNAGGVASELVGGNVVGLHVVCVGVTAFAGFRNVHRMHAR
jgi:hypothetical protein